MILKKLIAAVGVAGTLGAAAPAFADWYRPLPAPVIVPPTPVVVTPPAYGYGYGNEGYGYGNEGYGYGYARHPDYWRFRREQEWRHERWEREHRWHRWHRW